MRTYQELPLDLVDESADNPRTIFAADALEELKMSIIQHGMLEPIVARRAGDRYGERCPAAFPSSVSLSCREGPEAFAAYAAMRADPRAGEWCRNAREA